jgi:pimeloyl-ACP methyl ester carboxylesterase
MLRLQDPFRDGPNEVGFTSLASCGRGYDGQHRPTTSGASSADDCPEHDASFRPVDAGPAGRGRRADVRRARLPRHVDQRPRGWSSLPWLWAIGQPTLVVAGDDDPVTPLINHRVIATLMPQARLYTVPGGGHLLLLDSADRVGPVITNFLRES